MRGDKLLLSTLALILFLAALVAPPLSLRFSPSRDENVLLFENQALKAEVARLEVVRKLLSSVPSSYIAAEVYSRYPFSLKDELYLNAGSKQGIVEGEAVGVPVLPSGDVTSTASTAVMLIGQVKSVYPDTSVAETIFDERWKSPVRIGNAGVDSLLEGGTEPRLTLIPKTASIAVHDIVYSTAPSFPLGLPLGEVKEVHLSSGEVLQEGTISFPYALSSLRLVFIVKDHAVLP